MNWQNIVNDQNEAVTFSWIQDLWVWVVPRFVALKNLCKQSGLNAIVIDTLFVAKWSCHSFMNTGFLSLSPYICGTRGFVSTIVIDIIFIYEKPIFRANSQNFWRICLFFEFSRKIQNFPFSIFNFSLVVFNSVFLNFTLKSEFKSRYLFIATNNNWQL